METISPDVVIGGTYNIYHTESLARSNTEDAQSAELEIIESLDEQTRLNAASSARYCRITGTEVVVALEGKNRVELYRRRARPIIARVTSTALPDAATMRMHGVWTAKHLVVVSALDVNSRDSSYWTSGARTFAVVPFPEAVVPILRAYGVVDGHMLLPHIRWRVANARCEAVRDITKSLMVS